MTSETLSALVAALLSVAIGLSVYLEDRRRPAYRAFALFCFNLFIYHLANFVGLMIQDPPAQLFGYLAALGIPLTALRFFRTFLSDDPGEVPTWDTWALFVAVVLFGALVYVALFPHPRVLFWYKTVVFCFVVGGGLVCTGRIYGQYGRTKAEVDRTRLKYVITGLLIMLIVLTAAYLPWFSSPTLPALGILFVTLYLYFLSQTLFHHRLLDLQEVLARVSILAAMVLIISAVYGVLLAWVDPEQPGMFLFNTIISSVIVLILVDPLRNTIQERVNRYIFREKFELSQHLLELNRQIRHVIDLEELSVLVMQSFERTRRITQAALYVAAEDGSGFMLRSHLGQRPPERLDAITNASFLDRLKTAGMLMLDTLIMEREAERLGWTAGATSDQVTGAVIRTMEELGAGVCLPLAADDQLLGLVVIDDDRMREPYSTDELDLFKGVAGQIAITLQNSRLFQLLRERDRLAVLGQMSAGMAHEIRNPLGAIKGAAQYLRSEPDHEGEGGGKDDAAPQISPEVDEFLGIIIQEVDRLNRVVSQFLDYARPDRGDREMLQLNDVVRRSSQMLEAEAENVTFQLELDEQLPETRANAEQLHQVFLNLGLNALQALPEDGELTITTRAVRRVRRPGTWLEVAFQDNGSGIEPQNIKSLFIPFFTTKGGGSGLGLPISQRIAENHGGTIRVASTPGKGSTFTLVLPRATGETTTSG